MPTPLRSGWGVLIIRLYRCGYEGNGGADGPSGHQTTSDGLHEHIIGG